MPLLALSLPLRLDTLSFPDPPPLPDPTGSCFCHCFIPTNEFNTVTSYSYHLLQNQILEVGHAIGQVQIPCPVQFIKQMEQEYLAFLVEELS